MSSEEFLKDIIPFEWSPKVVYKVYCNDTLEGLSVEILKDMVEYINSIIEMKARNN
jgi:hypothetical protein